MSFDVIVQRVLLDHKRIYNYHFGWKLLFDRDPLLEKILTHDENLDVDCMKDLKNMMMMDQINKWRYSFIAMLQLEFPEHTKLQLLNLLQIKNVDLF